MFFHENAGNIGLRMDYFDLVYKELHCDIIIVAYRGYSNSTGVASEHGLTLDALAVLDYFLVSNSFIAQQYINGGGIFIVGRSLGGAVAAKAVSLLSASKLDMIDGLILENTWTSLDDLLFDYLLFLAAFSKLILRNHWDTLSLIPQLDKVPMMQVWGL